MASASYIARAQSLGRATAWAAIGVGTLALIGWITGSPFLKGAIGTSITIKTNTALCMLLAGFSILAAFQASARARRLSRACALAIALIGGATILEHAFAADFGIDQLLFREPPGETATASPNRMGPPASIGFLSLGLALALGDVATRGRRPFRYLPLVATAVSLVGVVGYITGTAAFYANDSVSGIAWPTAVALLLLSVGALTTRPDNVIFHVLMKPDAGGEVARRLLIPALVLPIVAFLAEDSVIRAGWFSEPLAHGVLSITMVFVLGATVLLTAHCISVGADSTVAATQQLRRSEDDLRDFFDNASIGLHCIDPAGIIVRANKADMDLLGYSKDEYIGRHIAEFHADPEVIADALRRLHAGENIRELPARLRAKDGSIRDVLIDSSVYRENGKFIHTRCFTRDVTEQRRAEAANRRLAAIVESSQEAIISKDLNGVIRSWNRGAEQFFGYRAEEMIGRPIASLIPPDRLDEETEILNQIRLGQLVDIYETARIRRSGERVAVWLSISPIHDADGTVMGASTIVRDITERKRIEQEREALLESERAARAEAERAARTRDEFLAVVSHELRTPLNSVLGWAQLLKHTGINPQTTREAVEAIERGARAQVKLIEDLLDTNRIMTGKMTLDLKPIRLASIMEAAIATVQPAADTKEIRIRTALDSKLDRVLGDATRLQQVIWNLLSNAVKFTPKGGDIDVLLQRVDSDAEIVVTDSGAGIKPEFLPHAFERFRQADASTTRRHGGLGLGLSIVKNLVELHGGTVSASSDGEGRGATFRIRLPLAPKRLLRSPAAGSLVPLKLPDEVSLADLKVLVVEDDLETRDLIERILKQRDAVVYSASGGEEALAILKAQSPDVLVSDIGMPQMDGLQLIRRVRELHRGRPSLPAVALTAYARSEDRTKVMLAGFHIHISKPVEPQELIAAIASVSGRTTTPVASD